MRKIELGDKVKDTVTGFTGIAVARTNWIAGCDRIIVQPECKKGKQMDLEETTRNEELEGIAVFVHGALFGFHALGVFYNLRKVKKIRNIRRKDNKYFNLK